MPGNPSSKVLDLFSHCSQPEESSPYKGTKWKEYNQMDILKIFEKVYVYIYTLLRRESAKFRRVKLAAAGGESS